MLTISSSSLPPVGRGPASCRRRSSSSDLYRPRTIIIEKAAHIPSYGFSIQTYGFASLNLLSKHESASSLLSSSSESTTSRESSTSNSFCTSSQLAPIQLVTYVDHVQDKSPAWEAGLRSGSVILSVNDQSVENDDHETLVQRITQTSMTKLKLVVIQQNINKQIALCEQLQQLHKQLHEKEEELKELSKQETGSEVNVSVKESNSSSLQPANLSDIPVEHGPSFCHDKIPLDWRQSVANFAHQQKLATRTLPAISSTPTSKYTKNRQANPTQHYQRSMSLSTIVLNYSKSSLLRHQPPLVNNQTSNHRRACSFEEIFCSNKTKADNHLSLYQKDESMIASGCSLAMDLSRISDHKQSQPSSSSSSSSTINVDDKDNTQKDKLSNNNRIHPFKWKLRINK